MREGSQSRTRNVTTLPEAVALVSETHRNFQDGALDDVAVGPRHEVTVRLRPLVWQGARGTYGPALTVRFGGIADFDQVAEKFRMIPSLQSEIGFLGPDPGSSPPKAAGLAFRFEAERCDVSFGFCCRSVSVTE